MTAEDTLEPLAATQQPSKPRRRRSKLTDDQRRLLRLRSTAYGALIGVVVLDRLVPEIFSSYSEDFGSNIVTLTAFVLGVILWWLLDPILIPRFSGRGGVVKRAMTWLGIAAALLISILFVIISVQNNGADHPGPEPLFYRGSIVIYFYVVPMLAGLCVVMLIAELVIRAAKRYAS